MVEPKYYPTFCILLQPDADVFGAAYDYTWQDRELDLDEILKRGHRYVAYDTVLHISWSIVFTDSSIYSPHDRRANAFDKLMEVARWRPRTVF